jgi:hypothetical protein
VHLVAKRETLELSSIRDSPWGVVRLVAKT